jgi:pimeloyl-ACP methyl ester carboxylesterase
MYWHRRTTGEDRMRILLEEFTQLIGSRFGLHPRPLLGWSMGGYGALLAAERHPARFPAVAVSSAAVWPSYARQHAAVPDAFDGPADPSWQTTARSRRGSTRDRPASFAARSGT